MRFSFINYVLRKVRRLDDLLVGSSFSPVLANLFVETFEQNNLKQQYILLPVSLHAYRISSFSNTFKLAGLKTHIADKIDEIIVAKI